MHEHLRVEPQVHGGLDDRRPVLQDGDDWTGHGPMLPPSAHPSLARHRCAKSAPLPAVRPSDSATRWRAVMRNHSHSIVAGGLPEMSYTTRLMPRTSLMMRLLTLPSRLCGSSAP